MNKPKILSLTRKEEKFLPYVEKTTKNLEEKDPTLAPVNEEALKLGKVYRGKLPGLIGDNMLLVRDFFLSEIAPLLLASSNGIEDAKEILANALEEDPAVLKYSRRLESMVDLALDIKMSAFVASVCGLTTEQSRLLSHQLFNKENGGESLKEILSRMFPVSNMPGPQKGTEVPLRGLQDRKSRRVNARNRRPSNSPE